MTLGKTKESEWKKIKQVSENIHHSATIHPDVVIGKNVKIGANCVIGFDGFNYERDKNYVPHLKEHFGTVVISDNVEIHSCVCIDRGLTGDTILEKNVKIDNLVHIAHDVTIGQGSNIVAGTVIGGYVKIGKYCFLGINTSIKPLIVIGDYSYIGMASVVLKNVPPKEIWCGSPARKLRDNTFFNEEK